MLKLDDLSYWEKNSWFGEIDFLVIGAGIVGCSTALHLRKRYPEANILVLERGWLPAGASTKNAGFACFGSVTELADDLSRMPEHEVWETVAQRYEGLQYLREIIGDRHLDFQPLGSWDLILEEDHSTGYISKLEYLNEQLYRISGQKDVYSEDRNAVQRFGFQGIKTSFHNRLEGQIDTGKMMRRFHALLAENDILLLTGIDVTDLYPGEKDVEILTSIGKIRTSRLAICVNGFASRLLPEEDVSPARAQVLITKPLEKLPFEGTFHFNQGYYYFRNIHNRVLFGGGRNLDIPGETTAQLRNTGPITDHLKQLLKDVILPETPFEVDYSWAGIMGMGRTKKPIVKLVHPRIAVGVRLGGMGVAIGTLTGKSVAEKL